VKRYLKNVAIMYMFHSPLVLGWMVGWCSFEDIGVTIGLGLIIMPLAMAWLMLPNKLDMEN